MVLFVLLIDIFSSFKRYSYPVKFGSNWHYVEIIKGARHTYFTKNNMGSIYNCPSMNMLSIFKSIVLILSMGIHVRGH